MKTYTEEFKKTIVELYENGNKRASSDDYSYPAIIAVQLSHIDHVEILYPSENSEVVMTYNLQTSSKAAE